MPEPSDHLSDDELNRLIDAVVTPAADVAHVDGCGNCRGRLDALATQQRRLDALRSAPGGTRGASCPEPLTWWKVARRTIPDSEASGLTAHAARCGYCSRRLRETLQDMEAELALDDAVIAALPSSGAAGMAQQTQRLLGASKQGRHAWSARHPIIWLVAASIAAVGVTAVCFFMGPTPDSANRLLARAYEAQRTLDLRFPGAAYSPLRQERGGLSARSEPLVEASAMVLRALNQHPADPRWLQASGRLELLEWRYNEAITDLSQAAAIRPNDPAAMADLAGAYFERGQALDDAADYQKALDLVSQAISRDTRRPEFHFNRAVTLASLSRSTEAVREWEEYLHLEPAGAWADEARMRLDELRRRLP